MIRSFDWRDVGLVRRLADQGICLDAETCHTRGWQALQAALLAYLSPHGGTPTYVWHANGSRNGPGAFGQMQHRQGEERARLLFIAPACATAADRVWEDLIEGFAAEAGQRGAHNLVATVPDDSPEFEALRRLGFAIYARQSIWRLAGRRPAGGHSPGTLRARQPADDWGIQVLYSNVVPRLVQQVEAPPRSNGRGYVLESDGEILAFLHLARGALGAWCEPYLHPEAYSRSAEVIESMLRLTGDGSDRPLYFCVKSYQEWLHDPLQNAGFEAAGEHAVMVKRLAVRLAAVEPALVAVLENTRAKVTSPMVKSTRRSG
jgi:hypothetical protein